MTRRNDDDRGDDEIRLILDDLAPADQVPGEAGHASAEPLELSDDDGFDPATAEIVEDTEPRELAAELSSYGISVVHDRTLHDGESYNDAYENSLASIQSYLAKYPSIVYVLDLHRDAVQDANGTQYKLVTAEDPAAAQVSLIMGVAHDGWQDNLRLAIAVQEKLESQSPTLMRPITLLNYRYNQFAAPGSLLVEVGAAGNSLDEALRAARLFAKGFAETILGR